MKKAIIIIIVLAVLGGVYYIYGRGGRQAEVPADQTPPVTENAPDETPVQQPDDSLPAQPTSTPPAPAQEPDGGTQGTFSTGESAETPADGPDVQVVQVEYDGSAFSPATVTIKSGDYVIFKNVSSTNVWPASDPHPTHTDYPGFDAKKNVAPGGTYRFQFTKAGTWGYHNHLNPSQRGTVVVTQ